MSTNLTCFLFGIPVMFFWILGLKKGLTFGRAGRWVRRNEDPLGYWFVTLFSGTVAVGLLVMPIFTWLGIRSE